MSDNGELMLEILKSLQTGQSETHKSLRRVEQRLSSIERQNASDRYDVALFREDFDDLKTRMERVERRLELHDPSH